MKRKTLEDTLYAINYYAFYSDAGVKSQFLHHFRGVYGTAPNHSEKALKAVNDAIAKYCDIQNP